MKKWIAVIIGACIVIGSAIGFSKYMKSYELDVTMMNTIKPVRMIQPNELITREMLRIVPISTVQHMQNAVVDMDKIIGMRAIIPIGETEEILSWKIGEDHLYPDENEQYLGFKASIIDTVINMVRRGDKVDVWVEYASPKIYNPAGQEVDQSQLSRVLSENPNITTSLPVGWTKVYNKLLVQGLTVAYVKDQEGREVVDNSLTSSLGIESLSALQRDSKNMEFYRQNASAFSAYITFIINPEQYSLVAEGQKEGIIKLGLPGSSISIGEINGNSKEIQVNPSEDQGGME